jgi:hypothetical protein
VRVLAPLCVTSSTIVPQTRIWRGDNIQSLPHGLNTSPGTTRTSKTTMMKLMKKLVAVLLVTFFSLAIIASPRAAQQNPANDLGGAVAQLIVLLLFIAGLFYSVRWYMKLDGHTYKLTRQAWASILFWYSMIGVLMGLMFTRSVSVIAGTVMMVVWALVGFACWKWRGRLRRAEAEQSSGIA